MSLNGSWDSAACTALGKVRVRNEDAFLDCPQQGLWVVADGMGGHRGGDIASQLIVASLAELPRHVDFDERIKAVRQCLHWLNRRLVQDLTVAAGHEASIMGSTVMVLMMEGDRAVCIWAGDSRCYLWRQQQLFQLTKDHSLQQQLIDVGKMSAIHAREHPDAFALTRAIGAAEQLTLDVLELVTYPGDVFLLCSDGLYQELSGSALGNALSLATAHFALERLFKDALHGAAKDNLTAVVVRR